MFSRIGFLVSILLSPVPFLLFSTCPLVAARPRQVEPPGYQSELDVRPLTCDNPARLSSVFDYSAKKRRSSNDACPKRTVFERDTADDDDYSCSENKPCKNGACCPKATGYCNYGPDACGTNGQSPNDVCWSHCDAHAECGRYADPPGKTCPLNVCCSQFGFCGLTSDFCTKSSEKDTGCQSNCDQPQSGKSGGNVQNRIIGYYESWAHARSCSGMTFQDIPVESLTHLNCKLKHLCLHSSIDRKKHCSTPANLCHSRLCVHYPRLFQYRSHG